MAERTEEALIREIDDELRQEQVQKVWARYGRYILAAAAGCVIAVAAWQVWHNHQMETRRAQGERFAEAQKLALAGNVDGAKAALRGLAGASDGYALLARFQEAAIESRAGNADAALQIYRNVAGNKDVPALYQGLATVLAVGLELNKPGADTKALADRLAPLAKPDSPWRHSAQELLAAIAMKGGDTAGARKYFDDLAKDPETPARMRQRASEMLTILR